MITQGEVVGRQAVGVPMNLFERWLTLWVALCILVGIGLGQFFPAPFQFLGRLEVAQVNLPVGVLIWVMIIPMLMKIDFGALGQVKSHWKGIGVTLFINWAVKPFSMALLAWIFIRQVFAPGCRRSNWIAMLPGSFCWPRRPVPPWSSSGAGSPG